MMQRTWLLWRQCWPYDMPRINHPITQTTKTPRMSMRTWIIGVACAGSTRMRQSAVGVAVPSKVPREVMTSTDNATVRAVLVVEPCTQLRKKASGTSTMQSLRPTKTSLRIEMLSPRASLRTVSTTLWPPTLPPVPTIIVKKNTSFVCPRKRWSNPSRIRLERLWIKSNAIRKPHRGQKRCIDSRSSVALWGSCTAAGQSGDCSCSSVFGVQRPVKRIASRAIAVPTPTPPQKTAVKRPGPVCTSVASSREWGRPPLLLSLN
mmetsp:Transcript_90678/g.210940  ORF Transcript_90678/g.210940 Transcript_90678/m.210940 type:complete len:262 (+) Transcript_90678:59-844(+)